LTPLDFHVTLLKGEDKANMHAAVLLLNPSPTSALALLRIAQSFAPSAELPTPDAVIFPLAGLRRLLGGPQAIASEIARRAHEQGIQGNIGIARNPDLALLAARFRRGVTLMEPGTELHWLGDLPLRHLPLDPETLDVLQHWGVHTLNEFHALPEAGLTERLGPNAAFLRQLTRGEWQRPLKLDRPESTYAAFTDLEHPLDQLEPLLFLLSRHIQDLCAQLDRQTLSTAEARLTLNQIERAIQLPVPTRDPKTLLRLIRHHLEAVPPGEPVHRLRVELLPMPPRQVQHNLYTPPAPEPEKLDLTLGRIRAFLGVDRAGVDRVGTPELLNTHRPDAWRLHPLPDPNPAVAMPLSSNAPNLRIAFRYFRPARKAYVELSPQGAPVRLKADGAAGRVLECAGPWIKSGDWWSGEASWSRREWDIGLDSGGLFRIYEAPDARRQLWFVEGAYD
jgi:protein ImuB